MSKLRDMIMASSEPKPASVDDRAALWAVELWALAEGKQRTLAAMCSEAVADEDATVAERETAALLLAAVEMAKRGEVPSTQLMTSIAFSSGDVVKESES